MILLTNLWQVCKECCKRRIHDPYSALAPQGSLLHMQSGSPIVTDALVHAQDLSADMIAAMLSCFVWGERSEGASSLGRDMKLQRDALVATARSIAQVCEDAGLTIDKEAYAEGFRPELMEALAGWCQGMRFADVLKIADRFFEVHPVHASSLALSLRVVCASFMGVLHASRACVAASHVCNEVRCWVCFCHFLNIPLL